MTPRASFLVLVLVLVSLSLPAAACLEAPPVDLQGPRVVASSLGAAAIEVSVLPLVTVDFSEPLDPSSVHGGAVALLPWEEVGACALTPICEKGLCARGRCVESPLGAGDRAAIDAGDFAESLPLALTLAPGPAGPDSRLQIRPRRPLAGHTHHTLVVGAGLRDRSGAALVDDSGAVQAWSRDFTTAAAGSGGPEPRLIWPAPGQVAVPTNLVQIDLAVFPPVPLPQPEGTILLEAQDGGDAAILIGPEPCPGWVPGTCLRLRPQASLRPGVHYRPAGGTLVDRVGRPALLPAIATETWFVTGDGPDLEPPAVMVQAGLRGRCLVLAIAGDEPLAAVLTVEGETRQAALSAGWGTIGVAVDARALGQPIAWSLALTDLAANVDTHAGELEAGASLDPSLPALAITEVLANPAGPEPDAEFVELWLASDAAGPVELAGLILSDLGFEEVRATWAAGDDPPGDPLPAATIEPGQRAIIVGSGWAPALGDDPAPPIDTPILVVDASLGSGGLKNAGEPLSLWTVGADGPVLLAGYGDWIDTGKSAWSGRSVVGDGDGCDLADRWRPHPQGRSGPGLAP